MPRVKIQLADNIKRVVTFDSDATKGATLGTNVFLPSGAVGTPTTVLQWLGGALPSTPVSGGGGGGIPIGNYLTTKGDLLTRDSQVQRLPIGATDDTLRVVGGMPAWVAPAGLTKQDDTNVTLTLTGTPSAALLAATDIQVGWTGELAATRGGTGRAAYIPGDMLYADTDASLETVGAGPDGWVLTMYGGFPDWQPPPSGDPNATYLTETDESMFLPNSRQVLAGSNITFDDSVPNQRTLNATGGGGSVSITAGTGLVATPSPITGTGAISLDTVLAAYAGGDTPSAFTLGIVDSVDAAAWRTAIGAGTSTVTPAALTKTDDTNVTLTLGGTPATALLQAASLTLGWTGQLGPTRGGTGIGTYTTGDILYASASNTLSKLAAGTNTYVLTMTAGIPAWAAPGSGSVANPTATIGLTAVNGSASSAIRSDGAPALSQAIAPVWTGAHVWRGAATRGGSTAQASLGLAGASTPVISMTNSGASANQRSWEFVVGGTGDFVLQGIDDAVTAGHDAIRGKRSSAAVSELLYGNVADSTVHRFYGNVGIGGRVNNILRVQSSVSDDVGWEVGRLSSTRITNTAYDRAGGKYCGLDLYGTDFAWGTTGAGTTSITVNALNITQDGRLYGGALHNNSGAVTGTTQQYIASGTYTPTLTNVGNTSALSATVAQWMRVGNVVTVSGSVTATYTLGIASSFRISLPIASALASVGQVAGTASTVGSIGASISADATNDEALFSTGAVGVGATATHYFTFTYVVV